MARRKAKTDEYSSVLCNLEMLGKLSSASAGSATSDSETVTTFGTTGADHRATATSLHADQEAMGALATDDGGLVSAFHVQFCQIGSNALFQCIDPCLSSTFFAPHCG